MATIPLPPDFSEFLKLLSDHEVRYLLIGGYAVGYHGYVRATADMDIWIDQSPQNAKRMTDVLQVFGFNMDEVEPELFMNQDRIIRMGVPPVRIEVLTSVSGVKFTECYTHRIEEVWNGTTVHIISLEKLKQNKRASGRLKDLADLEHLE